MPFTTKSVLPVLPKPDHLVGPCQSRPLSAIEDKELRKKLRNRQSALAARERKKARMLELERKVAELQQSNKILDEENMKLRRTLNEILRSASTSGLRSAPKTVATGTRYYIAKPMEILEMQDSQSCSEPLRPTALVTGTIDAPKRCGTTSFIPGQLTNALINYKATGRPSDQPAVVNGNQVFTEDQSPIDYSMNGNRPENRERKFGLSCSERKSIKIEDVAKPTAVSALGRRQQDILRTLSMGNFYQCLTLSPTTEFVTVKQEASDPDFTSSINDGGRWNNTNEAPSIGQVTNETDTPFAQALKRSANAMLLSSKQFSSNRFTNDSAAFDSIPKNACKRKQALPSIDAVFHPQSKASRLLNSLQTECSSTEYSSKKPFLQMETFAEDADRRVATEASVIVNREEQPLSLVKSSTEPTRPRDPYLHQNSDETTANICYDLPSSVHGVTSSNVGLLPSELSAIIENYSNNSASENDDVLATIYDSSAGNSPLESVSSSDSGLGVEDDPLDWLPDASFFDF